MRQTRLTSIVEVLLNTTSGFILAMFIWQFVIPAFYPHLEPTMAENFNMTALFTIASIARGFLWRRLFNAGIVEKIKKLLRCL